MGKAIRIGVMSCACLLAAACSDNSNSNDLGGADLTSLADLAGVPTVKAGGVVVDGQTGAAVAGIELCVEKPLASPKQCVTSGADGRFSLTVPQNVNVVGATTATANYASTIAWGYTGATDRTDLVVGVIKTVSVTLLSGLCGVTVDDTKGIIAIALSDATIPRDGGTPDGGSAPLFGQADTAFAISPASGAGPCYTNESSLPDPSLTKTSKSGLGAFFNVTPTDSLTLTVAPPDNRQCTYGLNPPGTAANTFQIPVIAGAITAVQGGCR